MSKIRNIKIVQGTQRRCNTDEFYEKIGEMPANSIAKINGSIEKRGFAIGKYFYFHHMLSGWRVEIDRE